MSFRTTWCLLAAAFLLFGYIVVFEHREEAAALGLEKEQGGELVARMDPRKVSIVEISSSNFVLRAENTAEGWMLVAPVVYPAQSAAVEKLVEAVCQLRRRAYVPPEELRGTEGGLEMFGLEPPKATIALFEGTNQHRLFLGNRTLIRDQFYLRKLGLSGVVVADDFILGFLPRSVDSWRDRTFVNWPRERFDQMTVRADNRVFEVERVEDAEGKWRFVSPMPARADGARLRELWQRLQLAQVTGFLSDNPTEAEHWGLEPAPVEVRFSAGTNQVLRLEFGKAVGEKAGYAARQSLRRNVVSVPPELVEIFRLPHTYFRDRQLVGVDGQKVKKVKVRGDGGDFTLIRNGEGWQLEGDGAWPVETQTVTLLLKKLAQIQVEEFAKDVVTDFAAFGLADPAASYEVHGVGSGREEPVTVSFSRQKGGRVYARRSDEPSVYAVGYNLVSSLPQARYEFRDKELWNFEPKELAGVTVEQKGRRYRYSRGQGGDWSSDVIHSAALEETAFRLGRVRAVDWVGRDPKDLGVYGISDESYRLELDFLPGSGASRYQLRFGKLSPSGDPYAAVQLEGEEVWTVFRFPAELFSSVLSNFVLPAEVARR